MKTYGVAILAVVAIHAQCAECCAQLFHVSRANRACCLSGRYNYSSDRLSSPVTAFSFPGTAVTAATGTAGTGSSTSTIHKTTTSSTHRTAAGTTTTLTTTTGTVDGADLRTKTYPLRVKALKSEQCQISRVVVTLSSDGTWSVDFLAEQNPLLVAAAQRPRVLVDQQNEFYIAVRPLFNNGLVADDALDNVVVASATRIALPPFWLRRGQQRQLRVSGNDGMVRRHFDAIGYVAVDLQYR